MTYTIQAPQRMLPVSIGLPASKSISNRALILSALSRNIPAIENLSDSDDTQVLLKALQSTNDTIDIGATGTAMRFLTAYFSQLSGTRTLTGSERMKNRPIKILVQALNEIGGEIRYIEKEGFPPLHIQGRPLKGGRITLDGSVSSQYISALMMIAPCTKEGLSIRLEETIISRPYIDMTLRLMETFGAKVYREEQTIRIPPQTYRTTPFKVESDWSAASYWHEIQALSDNPAIELTGLTENSLQGDAACSTLFKQFGIRTEFSKQGAVLSGSYSPKESSGIFEYDFINEPDLVQTLAVTCCLLAVPFRFTGLQSLRIKETDRISALQIEMEKLGYRLKTGEASLSWEGERCEPLPHPIISTYEDHRMAMAFAPACLKTGKISILHPEVVSKSYPSFWKHLEKAGFIVREESR